MDSRQVYRVGRYRVDLSSRRVSSSGSTIELGWRHFEALRLLVEADGGVVKKEEFFEQVWQGQFVDESNLTKCIAQLRKSLNNGDNLDYLETVPRVGYRLAVAVQPEPASAAKAAAATLPRRWWPLAAMLLAVLVGVAWYGIGERRRLAEANAAYEEGRRLRRQKKDETIGPAIESFRKAIELNPGNAQYYGSLAEALTKVPAWPTLDRKLMLETAEKGVALDPRCAGCNSVLGFILFSKFWDWKRAEQHLRAGLELNPKDAGARGYYAMLLASQGRLEDALRQVDTGIGIDPYHSTMHTIRSGVLYFLKRYPEAAAAAERAVSFGQRQISAWDWRLYAHLMRGNAAAAFQGVEASQMPYYPPNLDAVLRENGLAGAARRVLQTMDKPALANRRAHWRMVLGDRSAALNELEEAYEAREFDLIYVAVDPMFQPLNTEPRFRNLLAKMNLGSP